MDWSSVYFSDHLKKGRNGKQNETKWGKQYYSAGNTENRNKLQTLVLDKL